MTLGETLDQMREEHRLSELGVCKGSICRICEILDRIQKAYEEMIASLQIVDLNKPIDILKAP